MGKFYKLIGVIALLALMVSCNKEDPLPLPEVNFRTDPEIIEVGKEVLFENLTTKASTYLWDFGDGQTSTEINPKVIFDESGIITVTLYAFTDDNQSDSLSRDINVGERVMTDLLINSLRFVNEEGQDWDDPTGLPDSTKYPDFVLFFGPEDDPGLDRFINTFPPLVDLAPFELPIGFSLNPDADPYVLTDEDWVLEFYDFDGVNIEEPQPGDFELMQTLTFNPVQISTSAVNEDGQGFIQISAGQYSVDLLFQIE